MTYKWTDLNPHQIVAMKGLGGDKGVFVRLDVLRALGGDCSAAVLYSQYVYWSQSEQALANDGWFYLTTNKVTQEIGMSADVQKRVRQKLVELGLIEFQRRGMPGKNFYRINFIAALDLIAKENYQLVDLPPTSEGESHQQVSGFATHIVNKGVNSKRDKISTASRRYAGKDKVSVLGAKFDDFLAWLVATYPLSSNGLPVTEHQARRIAKKLGDVAHDASDEDKAAARAAIQKFILAVKNIRREVDAGRYETKFVPKFDNFAGLGISYGREPAYHAWAAKVEEAPKQQKLVV